MQKSIQDFEHFLPKHIMNVLINILGIGFLRLFADVKCLQALIETVGIIPFPIHVFSNLSNFQIRIKNSGNRNDAKCF